MKKLKISFCIVCMNRLHQLKETLPINIEENKDYGIVEFVVLDYNSQDGMEEWVRENMTGYMQNGTVVYYRTSDPQTFNHSHSKNMAFKLATGDIVCNINADHFIGLDFAYYVNEQFNNDEKIVITPLDILERTKKQHTPRDVMGKVCVKKSDFYEVTGFDENFGNYGFEDCDFVHRLEMAGIKRSLLNDPLFLKFISHDNEERYSLKRLTNGLHALYVHYLTPCMSKVLFLYTNQQFEFGTLIDNSSVNSSDPESAFIRKNNLYEFSRKENKWEEGVWHENNECIEISGKKLIKRETDLLDFSLQSCDNELYYKITDDKVINGIFDFIYVYSSRAIMEQNLDNQKIIVNEQFGSGLVYKNFDSKNPITI